MPTDKWSTRDQERNIVRKNQLIQRITEYFINERELSTLGGAAGFLAEIALKQEIIPKIITDKEAFYEKFNDAHRDKKLSTLFEDLNLTYNELMCIAKMDRVPLPDELLFHQQDIDIREFDTDTLGDYLQNNSIRAAIAIGNSDQVMTRSLETIDCEKRFPIHSVGKVFTGAMALKMIEGGVISEEDLNRKPPQFSDDVQDILNGKPQIKAALERCTLKDLMLHQSGLGDYLTLYSQTIRKELAEATEARGPRIPEMGRLTDFLEYAEDKVYDDVNPLSGEPYHYSNLGILLVGLAIEHAYNSQPQRAAEPQITYDQLLKDIILTPAGITSFSTHNPGNDKVYVNSDDPAAPYIVGSPAGGYWMTVDDLRQFGQWLIAESSENETFMQLMQNYGGEFYDSRSNVIAHAGGASSSAMLACYLNTGTTVAILSDQQLLAPNLLPLLEDNAYRDKIEKIPGEWAQQDLDKKSEILQTLYSKIGDLSKDDKADIIGFLAVSLGKEATEIDKLFIEASEKKLTGEEFEDFFELLKPLDAKLLAFNCEALGIKSGPKLKESQPFPENMQALLEEYMHDSGFSETAVSFGNSQGQSIHTAPLNVYPIHSVAKVFTGILALMMIHKKPDGENSILSEAMLNSPLFDEDPTKTQLDPAAWDLLPVDVQTYIKDKGITLRQVMIHESGLGDYGYDSGTGEYRDKLKTAALEGSEAPVIAEIRDFLPFAEKETYGTYEETNKRHYSNLGITLLGLAVEHAYNTYQQSHPELLDPLNFFGMLNHYILEPANMSHFYEKAAEVDAKMTVQTNKLDKAARAWVGGPAGGYWTTTDDLVKFGRWLHEKCKDQTFRDLVKQYGQEFHEDGKICHPGNSPHASAFFFVDLDTGNTAALGSTNPDGVSLGVELTFGARIFTEEETLEEGLKSTISADNSMARQPALKVSMFSNTEQYRNPMAETKSDGEVAADEVVVNSSQFKP